MPDRPDSPELAETLTGSTSASGARSPGLAETLAEADAAALGPALPRVDRYVIKRRLGAGGMGVVYEATDPELGRDVAIKMLRRGASAERLRREAQALARLDHQNVVAVYDVGEHDGQVFVAMALVDGQNLREWLAASDHTTEQILRVLLEAAHGIIAAHDAGMIHRDLKPDNIFVARDGGVLVGDFGLATAADDEAPAVPGDGPSAASTGLTLTGHVLGTPAYMSPEQALGEATEKSDQFSFCVMAYEALYGTRPFAGASLEEIMTRVESGELAKPRRPRRVPAHLGDAIRRGLAADPARRFATMRALVAALERPRRRRWPYVVALAAFAVAGGAAVLITGRGPGDPAVACAPARHDVDRMWSPTRRDALRATLAGKHQPGGAIAGLVAQLDDYASRWSATRFEACVAGRQPAATARSRAQVTGCLDVAAVSLDQIVSRLPEVVDLDLSMLWRRVAALPAPEACTTDLASRLTLDQHASVVRDLAHAELASTLAEFAPLRAKAEAAGDRPAELDIALAEAQRAITLRELTSAEPALVRALELAEQLDALGPRARGLALLALVRCKQRLDPKTYLALAEAARQRLSEPRHAFEIDLLMEARAECAARSDPASAVAPLEQLRDRYVRRYGAGSAALVEPRANLALAYRLAGRPADAAREQAEATRLIAAVSQPAAAANQAATDANTAFLAGDVARAIDLQLRAIDLWKHAFGGDPAQSRQLQLQSTEIVAMMYEVMQRWPQAIEAHGQVLALVDQDPLTPERAQARAEAHAFRGSARLYVDDIDAAAADFERGLELGRAQGLAEVIAVSEIGLGRCWFARHEPQRAVRFLRDGLADHAKLPGSSFRVGIAQFTLAQALWQLGDKPGAARAAKQAEVSVARGLDESREVAIGSYGLPYRQAQFDAITRWRDEHR